MEQGGAHVRAAHHARRLPLSGRAPESKKLHRPALEGLFSEATVQRDLRVVRVRHQALSRGALAARRLRGISRHVPLPPVQQRSGVRVAIRLPGAAALLGELFRDSKKVARDGAEKQVKQHVRDPAQPDAIEIEDPPPQPEVRKLLRLGEGG